MDPLPSKMPKKPKNENPVDYTGRCSASTTHPGSHLAAGSRDSGLTGARLITVQIPPSTTYAVTPMKRPMEEDGEEKSPSKKKKKIQKKGIELTRGRSEGGLGGAGGLRRAAVAGRAGVVL